MKTFKQLRLKEDGMGAGAVAGPTNVTAGVAGIGAQGSNSNQSEPQSEPGVNKKKKPNPVMGAIARRSPPKA